MMRLLFICFSMIAFCGCAATDPPEDKGNGFELAYILSFQADRCGESAFGKRYREALIAKFEACPFTDGEKLTVYKRIVNELSGEVSKSTELLRTPATTKFVPSEDNNCKKLERLEVPRLKERLSEYDAGKIKLEEVLVPVKGKTGEPFDDSKFCEEALKPVEGAL